jgi:hypothetical protein
MKKTEGDRFVENVAWVVGIALVVAAMVGYALAVWVF